ncbi:hypothetical protein SP41_120 [Salmonella phage 41]|nr:hypothetical protein SP41_120 [Salmonella phage 41]
MNSSWIVLKWIDDASDDLVNSEWEINELRRKAYETLLSMTHIESSVMLNYGSYM